MMQSPNTSILAFRGRRPKLDPSVFIAANVVIIGDVEIAANASVWSGAVLRGDVCPIRIGPGSNVQDAVVMHGDEGNRLLIGADVTIGHRAIVHACVIEDGALIGMGAIVLDNARIGRQALIGAGSLVTSGKKIPERTMWMGVPARLVRDLDDSVAGDLPKNAHHYTALASEYMSQPG